MLDALLAFQATCRYPLAQLVGEAGTFLREQGPAIRRFYEARSAPGGPPPQLPRLRALRAEISTVLARLPAAALPGLSAWELTELLEELHRHLSSLLQLPKYLRLPTPGAAPPYVLGRHQTLEQVAQRAGSQDPGEEWARLALAGDLGEDDYGPEGGTAVGLDALRQGPRSAGRLLAVLGPQDGQLALGIDLERRLRLDAESQDLAALSPDATADQTLDILLTARRGSIPYAPQLGPRYDLLVGASQNLLGLPTVLRQLGELLGTDDTIASFQLVAVRQEADNTFLDLKVQFAAGLARSYALKSS